MMLCYPLLPADAATVSGLASGLCCLCHEAAAEQAAALLQQLLAALSHLASYWPQALLPHVPDLATLLLQPQLGSAEVKAALALLGRLMQQAPAAPSGEVAGSSSIGQPKLPALLLMPLLQQVAFGGSKDVKQWAAHTLALVQQMSDRGASSSNGGGSGSTVADLQGSLHGAAAAAEGAQLLLHQLWHHPLQARHWLASLQLELGSSGASSGAVASREQQQLDGSTLLVLCALLQHPGEPVQRAALRTAVAAVEVAPLLGLSLLPLLVQQLQRQVLLFLSGAQYPERPCALPPAAQ